MFSLLSQVISAFSPGCKTSASLGEIVTFKLVFTAEVAESAEKRKYIFVKTSASPAFSAVKSIQLNYYPEQSQGMQRIDDRYFDPFKKVIQEFENIKDQD